MILLVDNYDSFTYNLFQYMSELGARVKVVRNDALTLERAAALKPARIVLSPGPGRPEEAGVCVPLVRRFAGTIPIFGVCLGHQAIGEAFGGKVVSARRLMHGKTSPIANDGRGVYRGLPKSFDAVRYHSLVVARRGLPRELAVASTGDGEIMGLRHRRWAVEGVQFHPESILTAHGKAMLKNFLEGRR